MLKNSGFNTITPSINFTGNLQTEGMQIDGVKMFKKTNVGSLNDLESLTGGKEGYKINTKNASTMHEENGLGLIQL
jgi:hypothetical protein